MGRGEPLQGGRLWEKPREMVEQKKAWLTSRHVQKLGGVCGREKFKAFSHQWIFQLHLPPPVLLGVPPAALSEGVQESKVKPPAATSAISFFPPF